MVVLELFLVFFRSVSMKLCLLFSRCSRAFLSICFHCGIWAGLRCLWQGMGCCCVMSSW